MNRAPSRLLLPLFALLLASAGLAATRPIRVSYVSATAVYLDAGRADGLAVGERLRVARGGETIAELEVDFVAEHSASCRVVAARGTVQGGDEALRAAGAGEPAAAETPPDAAPAPPAPEPETAKVPAYRPAPAAPKRTRLSGSLAFGLRTLSDDLGPTTDETNARLSLRVRDIAGSPWELRVRGRRRELERDGYGPSVATKQDADRLYELSLAYAPRAGRFHLHLGRLGAGPFASLGDLDGLLTEVRLGSKFWVGAFGGSRPELAELGLESVGEKYGAFVRLSHDPATTPFYAELLVGGVTERDDRGEASRDFVAVESRFGSGSRWWLSQRAEIDLNRDWREEVAGSSTQVSNAALAASFRLSDAWRATVSYDQRRNLLTAETRPRPEEVFTRYFREGGRIGFDWQTRGGWSGAFGAGSERADVEDAATDSVYVSLQHARVFDAPLLVGGDGSFYSGGSAEGWVASLRTRYAFRAGHDLGLTLGASQTDLSEAYLLRSRSNQWARLSGTLQLPARLWLYGEYEVQTGDDFEGDRVFVEVGYRF